MSLTLGLLRAAFDVSLAGIRMIGGAWRNQAGYEGAELNGPW